MLQVMALSSRTARAVTQRNPVLKNQKRKKEGKKGRKEERKLSGPRAGTALEETLGSPQYHRSPDLSSQRSGDGDWRIRSSRLSSAMYQVQGLPRLHGEPVSKSIKCKWSLQSEHSSPGGEF
jgi:hypothetical protein